MNDRQIKTMQGCIYSFSSISMVGECRVTSGRWHASGEHNIDLTKNKRKICKAVLIFGGIPISFFLPPIRAEIDRAVLLVTHQPGAHPRGARGPAIPPWYLKNTIFSGFLPLNYVICIFEVCFLAFCYMGGMRKPEG